jgi:5-(carboxyamino)imidazole ribonucleotide synthase
MSGAHVVLPGGTIGMLGGGQLGRMFSMAAQQLGYHVIVFDAEVGSPAAQVADDAVIAKFDDTVALTAFASRCDVVTLEWENIPTATLEIVDKSAPVFPSAHVLRVAQDRRREKGTLAGFGLPVTPFLAVDSWADCLTAVDSLGLPLVIKTARCGYDGKGQRSVKDLNSLRLAYDELGSVSLVAEQSIDYRRELSLLVARNTHGEIASYPLFENRHANHILDVTICPAPDTDPLIDTATRIAQVAAESLGVVGLLCVEMFETKEGQLLINEIAPRPHNSGHLTIEAAETSQFEQHVRAVCGLPLGSTQLYRPAAMVNLLGDLWEQKLPSIDGALRIKDTHLHLYGKSQARVGRKMGHITSLGATTAEALQRAHAARDAFQG